MARACLDRFVFGDSSSLYFKRFVIIECEGNFYFGNVNFSAGNSGNAVLEVFFSFFSFFICLEKNKVAMLRKNNN